MGKQRRDEMRERQREGGGETIPTQMRVDGKPAFLVHVIFLALSAS